MLYEQTRFYRTKTKLEMEQRASISRAYPCKTGINRELISSFKAYAPPPKLIFRKKSLLGKALQVTNNANWGFHTNNEAFFYRG